MNDQKYKVANDAEDFEKLLVLAQEVSDDCELLSRRISRSQVIAITGIILLASILALYVSFGREPEVFSQSYTFQFYLSDPLVFATLASFILLLILGSVISIKKNVARLRSEEKTLKNLLEIVHSYIENNRKKFSPFEATYYEMKMSRIRFDYSYASSIPFFGKLFFPGRNNEIFD